MREALHAQTLDSAPHPRQRRRMSRSCAGRWILVSVFALLALTGCARPDPFLAPIEARTPLDFSLWHAKAKDALTPAEWRWFELIVQEHKYSIMQRGQASGSAAVDEAARALLDGRPLADVMREGLQMLLLRRSTELDEATAAIKANESRRRLIRPNDEQLLQDFNAHMERLHERAARLEDEVAQLTAAYAACEAKARR